MNMTYGHRMVLGFLLGGGLMIGTFHAQGALEKDVFVEGGAKWTVYDVPPSGADLKLNVNRGTAPPIRTSRVRLDDTSDMTVWARLSAAPDLHVYQIFGVTPGHEWVSIVGYCDVAATGGAGGATLPFEFEVGVLKVELKRNQAFSANNDLPTSDPVKQIYGGNPPVIGGPQDGTVGGAVFMSYVVEIEGTVVPNGLHLPFNDFGARQTYHATVTKNFDNQGPEVGETDVDEGQFENEAVDRDGEGGGDTYFLIDGPGPGKDAVQSQLNNDPHMTSILVKYEFKTYPTYKGANCGTALLWTVTIKATKQNGNIVWMGQ